MLIVKFAQCYVLVRLSGNRPLLARTGQVCPDADGDNNVKTERNQTGRRALLKAAGLMAAGGVSAAAAAIGGLASGSPRKRVWWVKAVDRPTLGEKTAGFERFSGDNIFEIYRQLITEREGAGSFEAEQAAKAKRLAAWMSKSLPGFRLPDHQLSEGAWTLMNSTEPRTSSFLPSSMGVRRKV